MCNESEFDVQEAEDAIPSHVSDDSVVLIKNLADAYGRDMVRIGPGNHEFLKYISTARQSLGDFRFCLHMQECIRAYADRQANLLSSGVAAATDARTPQGTEEDAATASSSRRRRRKGR